MTVHSVEPHDYWIQKDRVFTQSFENISWEVTCNAMNKYHNKCIFFSRDIVYMCGIAKCIVQWEEHDNPHAQAVVCLRIPPPPLWLYRSGYCYYMDFVSPDNSIEIVIVYSIPFILRCFYFNSCAKKIHQNLFMLRFH
jgi:hypothetical protein